jgi:integrase
MYFTYQGRQIRKTTGTGDWRLADNILSKVKVEIIEGRFFDRLEEQTRTFEELMDRYEKEHVERKLRSRGTKGYIGNLKGFFGKLTLAEITPRLIVEYKNKRYMDKVKPATINRELAAMKKAFNLAVKEWEWCRENPVRRVSMEKENNKRDRWLTEKEEGKVLGACLPWLREIVAFALGTGMRMGEVLGLHWAGVDLFRKTVTVFHSKNGERRTIPMNQTVFEALKAKARAKSDGSVFVFQTTTETAIDGSHLRRAFRSALQKAKIKDFRFHDLRHTFATRLVQRGVDLYRVQQLLGHKSGAMTQRYAHHSPESLRSSVEVLDQPAGVSTVLAQFAQPAEAKAMKECVSH